MREASQDARDRGRQQDGSGIVKRPARVTGRGGKFGRYSVGTDYLDRIYGFGQSPCSTESTRMNNQTHYFDRNPAVLKIARRARVSLAAARVYAEHLRMTGPEQDA